jgi:hypothetical protein
MLFVLLAIAGGVAAGLALGGSMRRLEALRLRRLWLLVAAVAAQLIAAVATTGTGYAAVLVASLLAAVGFLLANRELAGRVLLGLGLGLNALVIVANGAMPVELPAATAAGVRTGPLLHDPRHAVAGPRTRLPLLDDRIALPLPGQPQVVSAGDVLVAAGAGLMIAQAMRRRLAAPRPLRPAPPTRPSYPPREQAA